MPPHVSMRESVPLRWRKTAKVSRARLFEAIGSHRYSFPAINGLDRKMLHRLPRSGTFLEVGANDGYSQSNTYYLERVLGWKGILIEPLPELYERCRQLRGNSVCYNVACAAHAEPGETIQLADLDLMSVTLGQQDTEEEVGRLSKHRHSRISVPVATVSYVIDDAGFTSIDFMSVDVEGAELNLLAGLDLGRHAPQWLLIETDHPDAVADFCMPVLSLVDQLSHHDYLFARGRLH